MNVAELRHVLSLEDHHRVVHIGDANEGSNMLRDSWLTTVSLRWTETLGRCLVLQSSIGYTGEEEFLKFEDSGRPTEIEMIEHHARSDKYIRMMAMTGDRDGLTIKNLQDLICLLPDEMPVVLYLGILDHCRDQELTGDFLETTIMVTLAEDIEIRQVQAPEYEDGHLLSPSRSAAVYIWSYGEQHRIDM